jgi:hypothetical protein
MEEVMKLLKQAAILAAVMGVSATAIAQTTVQPGGSASRAEVRQDLMNVESQGYRPGDGDRTDYPANVQRAESRTSQQQGQSESYGGVNSGTYSSGMATQPMRTRSNDGTKDVYFGQ